MFGSQFSMRTGCPFDMTDMRLIFESCIAQRIRLRRRSWACPTVVADEGGALKEAKAKTEESRGVPAT